MIAIQLLPAASVSTSQHKEFRLANRIGETHNLGKVEGVVADGIENEVLEFVYSSKQVLPERCHCRLNPY